MLKPFATNLKDNGLVLKRRKTETLQINVGFLCNLMCKHCHLSCGPSRKEFMHRQTIDDVVGFASRNKFKVVDITGGAPEMVPDLTYLIDNISPHVDNVIMRSNLTLLLKEEYSHVLGSLIKNKVAIVASFPSINQNQTNDQRGDGVWQKTIESLRYLNTIGFGMPDSDLQLILVSNPTGAFLPVAQCAAEKRFKAELAKKWGIQFTNLYTFANVPLGRYKTWLKNSGNYEKYINKLSTSFNPATIDGLMCTSMLNISWDGYLYDCDFNLAANLPFSLKPIYVGDLDELPDNIPIATDNHCYSCTAGAGFT